MKSHVSKCANIAKRAAYQCLWSRFISISNLSWYNFHPPANTTKNKHFLQEGDILYKYVDKLQELHSTDILFICGNCTLIGRRAVPECLFWTALANVNSCQKKTGFDNTGRNIGAHNSTCSLFQFLLAQMHSTAQMHSCEVNWRWDFGNGRDEDGDCSRSKGFKGLSSCILSGAFHIDMPDAGWMFQVICKILLFKL